jgi:uroporphyrinogen decarboxylase
MVKFSPRERVVQAIQCQSVDRPPRGELCIDDAVIAEFCRCAPDAVSFGERQLFLQQLAMDLICISPVCSRGDRVVPESAGEVEWPDLARWAQETDLFPFVLVDGPLGWGIRIWGFEECILKIVKKDPDIDVLVNKIETLNYALAIKAQEKIGRAHV